MKYMVATGILMLVIGSAVATSAETTCQPTGSRTHPPAQDAKSVRPLSDFADRLESQYGKIVTYEEPMRLYPGDMELYGPGSWGPRRAFNPPDIKASAINLSLIKSAIASFNSKNDLPSFRVIESKHGFHIVPDKIRDVQGKSEPVIPLLDSIVSVPIEVRTPWNAVESLCKALNNVTRMRLVASCSLIWLHFDDAFTGGKAPKLEWGAEAMNARAALISLLEHSATSMTWRLNCQPSDKPEDRFCVLNISPMVASSIDSRGIHDQKTILYDRCPDCPNLRRILEVPPPPPPKLSKEEPIRVEPTAQELKLIRRVEPVYTELARRARIQGKVVLVVTVNEEGNVSDARVISGHPLLGETALIAVRQWKYSPTSFDGEPVPVITTVTVTFDLN
jgi:TonB family protein